MANYTHILNRLSRSVWASTPETVESVRTLLESAMRSGLPTDSAVALPDAALPPLSASAQAMFGQGKRDGESKPYAMHGATAIIPVFGVIGKHLSALETMCGGLDVDSLCRVVDMALYSDEVEQIVLWFHSPGGVVSGLPEAARFLAAANEQKSIFAYTDGMCCSAAYWLASQCENVFSAPSSSVGSIGVYLSWIDMSEAAESEGLHLELIKAGEFKAMGHPLKRLSEDERAMLQADVDEIWGYFKAAVTAKRDLDETTMQGQTFSWSAQLSTGLVDAHYDNIGELLADLASAS